MKLNRLASAEIIALASLAMLAFAANSLLCRLALKETAIGPLDFTAIRLLSGAAVLAGIIRFRQAPRLGGTVTSALVLFAYAISFSFAYVDLPAGLGALLLFGAAQVTMIGYGLAKGERLSSIQTMGLASASAGLVYLLSPGLSAPPMIGASLMIFSGASWGLYSLLGRRREDPVNATAGNFIRCVPLAGLLWLLALSRADALLDIRGAACAMVSGAVTSGCGYVIWYRAVREMSAISASTIQLTIPIIASLVGVVLLNEPISARLVVGTITVLGGVGIVIGLRRQPRDL